MQVFFKEILYLSLVVWQLLWTHITDVLHKENVYQPVRIGIGLATQGRITKQQVEKEKIMGKPCKSNPWLHEFSWGSRHSPSHQHLGASLIFLVLGVGVQDGKISALVSLSACHKGSAWSRTCTNLRVCLEEWTLWARDDEEASGPLRCHPCTMLGWPPPCHPMLVFKWYHLVRMH